MAVHLPVFYSYSIISTKENTQQGYAAEDRRSNRCFVHCLGLKRYLLNALQFEAGLKEIIETIIWPLFDACINKRLVLNEAVGERLLLH